MFSIDQINLTLQLKGTLLLEECMNKKRIVKHRTYGYHRVSSLYFLIRYFYLISLYYFWYYLLVSRSYPQTIFLLVSAGTMTPILINFHGNTFCLVLCASTFHSCIFSFFIFFLPFICRDCFVFVVIFRLYNESITYFHQSLCDFIHGRIFHFSLTCLLPLFMFKNYLYSMSQ